MTPRRRRLLPLSTITAALLCVAHPLGAQILPSKPVVFADGRAVVGGDVSLTTSCSHAEDGDSGCTGDTGFFNYSDYDHSTLRMARFGVTTSVRINNHISALADMRLENTTPRPYGAIRKDPSVFGPGLRYPGWPDSLDLRRLFAALLLHR